MENPYQPTAAPLLSQSPAFHGKRIVAWAILIHAAANLVGVLSGFSMTLWEIYGSTLDEAIANARLVRRIGYGLVGAILFWRFGAGVTSRLLLHALALFALVQIVDLSVSHFVFSVPVTELFDPWATARSLLAATTGTGVAWFSAKGSRTPRPLRDST